MATFSELQNNYPQEDRETLYQDLGGQWPVLVDHPNYQNTCATRMSIMFHASNMPIPDKYKEAIAGDNRTLIIKVQTMWDFVIDTIGQPDWGMSKKKGAQVTLPAKSGIICYHADYSDASGHFDLWTGTAFQGQLDLWEGVILPSPADMSDVNNAFDVSMWFIN